MCSVVSYFMWMNAGVFCCVCLLSTEGGNTVSADDTAHKILAGYTCREHLINSIEHHKGLLNVGMLPQLDCTK